VAAILALGYFFGPDTAIDRSGERALQQQFNEKLEEKNVSFNKTIASFDDCLEIQTTYTGETCEYSEKTGFAQCASGFSKNFLSEPICTKYSVSHMRTPESVKAIYISSFAAGSPSFRDKLFALVDETELNTVMIDIKEVDGAVSSSEFEGIDPKMKIENRIPNLKEMLQNLYDKGVYTIGRIVVFKDAHMVEQYPEYGVRKLNNKDVIWTDYGGKKYIDPGAEGYWDYIVGLADRAYAIGFDEINLDYIRFPSDGDMKNDWYPHSQDQIDADPKLGRSNVLTSFNTYFHEKLRSKYPDVVTSADVFGMVATNKDDLTIGQLLEPYLKQYDYVAPMVYPSHYPVGFNNLSGHPDNHPYEVVKYSMETAYNRAAVLGPEYPEKLRTWVQDFTCTWCKGYFPYRAAEVREQIQATYDAGLDSWMLWDAGNTYTRGALLEN